MSDRSGHTGAGAGGAGRHDRDVGGRADARGSWRSAGFVAAAGFVLLVAVLAVAVVGVSRYRGDPAQAPAAAPAATSPPRGRPGACAPSDRTVQTPSSAPAGVSWSLVGGVAVAASRSAGPLVTRGDVAWCFARTPTGALLAAWDISVRFLVAPGWRQVTVAQVAAGRGREAYLALRARADQHQPTSDSGSGAGYGQVAAFRFVAYTPRLAVVAVVTRSTAGQLQAYELTVVWDPTAPGAGGDWKLQLHDDGAPSTPATQITSLDGYAPWGAL